VCRGVCGTGCACVYLGVCGGGVYVYVCVGVGGVCRLGCSDYYFFKSFHGFSPIGS
jgi:hypothetical protein